VNVFAGVWIASLPKEMESKSILGVEFISPEVVNMEKWRPTISLIRYTPDSLLFRREVTESAIEGFHLARIQVETQNTSLENLIEVAREVVYPRIRRAVLIADVACRTGHIYISPEVIFKIKDSACHTLVGGSGGGSQEEPKEDILRLMEHVLNTCQDGFFMRKIERALVTWGEAQEEPEEELKTAKLWTALDALLRRVREGVWSTVCRRSITLAMIETSETINLFSTMSWRISFNEINGRDLRNFLREAYDVRNAVYHEGEEPTMRLGFALDLSSLTQVLILKMAEFAEKGYTWTEAVIEIDQRAEELGVGN
jgi:hypothetical protein